jgi:hypothetical protein
MKEALRDKPNNFISGKQAKWQASAQQLKTAVRKRDKAVPIEIDAGLIQDRDPKR